MHELLIILERDGPLVAALFASIAGNVWQHRHHLADTKLFAQTVLDLVTRTMEDRAADRANNADVAGKMAALQNVVEKAKTDELVAEVRDLTKTVRERNR